MSSFKPSTPRIYHRQGAPSSWFLMDRPRTSYGGDTGGGDVGDITGNVAAGVRTGGCAWARGQFGNCLSFDGSTGYVNCGNSPVLNPTGGLTLSAWFALTANNHQIDWLVARDDASLGRSYSFGLDPDNGTRLQINGAATLYVSGSFTVGQLHYLVATGSPSIGWSTYLDGQLVGNTSWSAPNTTTGPTMIGRRSYTGSEGYTPALIDNFEIDDSAWPAGEIARRYADPFWRLRPPRREFVAPLVFPFANFSAPNPRITPTEMIPY